MAAYSVFWTDSAKKDLVEIIEYISLDRKDAAESVFLRLKNKAQSLENMPLKGRLVPELKFFGIDQYREVIENPWRIIYRLEGNSVIVICVIDGRRNTEDIILDKILERDDSE